MNILFTLCGRAGSKGFKNKNLKLFLDIPLIYYSIAVIGAYIERNPGNDKIYTVLNTDSKELIDISTKQRIVEMDVIYREDALCGDVVPKVAVIKDCLLKMTNWKDTVFDIVVDLDITSPLRTVQDVENAINKKLERPDTDVVYSVTESRRNPYFNMVRKENDYFCRAIASNYTARQQAPVFYDMNASIYAYSVNALINKPEEKFFDNKCDAVMMRDTGILDIDSEEDFQLMQVIAEFIYRFWEDYTEIYRKASMLFATVNRE